MTIRCGHLLWSLFLLLCVSPIDGQDHQWWADNVNWDGSTHWSTYIVSSPRFLGPNALPIPKQNTGRIPKESSLELDFESHFSSGDHTYNTRVQLDYVFVPDKISFQLFWVPIEFFEVSHEVKTKRRIFHTFYNEQQAIGDINFLTNLQLLREEKHQWNAALRIAYRFPTSSLQGAARFTDAPGYHFDLGISRTLFPDKPLQWQPSLMLGFLVWQTNRDDQFQNDAFLYGLSSKLWYKKWQWEVSYRAYHGYLANGDHPQVLNTRLRYDFSQMSLHFDLGLGVLDNLYNRLAIGVQYRMIKPEGN